MVLIHGHFCWLCSHSSQISFDWMVTPLLDLDIAHLVSWWAKISIRFYAERCVFKGLVKLGYTPKHDALRSYIWTTQYSRFAHTDRETPRQKLPKEALHSGFNSTISFSSPARICGLRVEDQPSEHYLVSVTTWKGWTCKKSGFSKTCDSRTTTLVDLPKPAPVSALAEALCQSRLSCLFSFHASVNR